MLSAEGQGFQQGQLVSFLSLWIWAFDQKAFPHMTDVSEKECLMQYNWRTVLTGNKLQWMPGLSIAARGNDQILQWLLNIIRFKSLTGKQRFHKSNNMIDLQTISE